ncbi:hypothetical protein BG004_003104 [Podila humilis]|nr:hypothetical protein BG004_003104 [Podila humilis]
MGHHYDLTTHTYFDVKVLPEALDQILASTTSSSHDNNSLLAQAGVEYLGHVGELPNHLLYRIPKLQGTSTGGGGGRKDNANDGIDNEEVKRTQKVVDKLSAIAGVVHVDVQVPKQRIKRDEL